jgi:hypothetical protein
MRKKEQGDHVRSGVPFDFAIICASPQAELHSFVYPSLPLSSSLALHNFSFWPSFLIEIPSSLIR